MTIDRQNTFFRPFKELEEVRAVKKQNAGHFGMAIFLICCVDHFFQLFDRNVVADMAAINDGGEHEDPRVGG